MFQLTIMTYFITSSLLKRVDNDFKHSPIRFGVKNICNHLKSRKDLEQ
jgi:hypothetical protein